MSLIGLFGLSYSAKYNLLLDAVLIIHFPGEKFYSMTNIEKTLPELTLKAYYKNDFVDINLKKYFSRGVILLFYPLDFTFVCPTEITGFNKKQDEFEKEGFSIVLVSCDSIYSHKAWANAKDGGIYGNTLPMLSDAGGNLSRSLGIYIENEGRSCRSTIIAYQGTIIYELVHNDLIGRSLSETLRVVKAYNFTRKNGQVCPLDWEEKK